MFLKDLPVGSKGRIVSFGKEHPEYRRRLVMLGATPGTTFEIVRIAPSGIRSKSACAAASSACAATRRNSCRSNAPTDASASLKRTDKE